MTSLAASCEILESFGTYSKRESVGKMFPSSTVSILSLLPGVSSAVSEGCVGWTLLCGGRQGDAG